MQRKVQLWRFLDSDNDPALPIAATKLHRFLRDQEASGADMTLTDTSGVETQLVVPDTTDPHFVLHRIRNQDLPNQRRRGRVIGDLDSSVDELAEGSHILLLPRNMIAFLGTGFSPRPARFAEWIRRRLDWDVWLEPVLRPDAGGILDQIRKVTKIEVKISADEAQRLDISNFFQGSTDPLITLQAAQRVQEGGIISLSFSVGRGDGADQGFFRSLVERLRGADLTNFRAARAKVYL